MVIKKPKKIPPILSVRYPIEVLNRFDKIVEEANELPCCQVYYFWVVESGVTEDLDMPIPYRTINVCSLNLDLTNKERCLEKINEIMIDPRFERWHSI